MARVRGLRQLAARKRELVAEAEMYRQQLQLDLKDFRLYGAGLRRTFFVLRLANPVLLAVSLAGAVAGARGGRTRKKRRSKVRRLLAAALMGWRMYRRFGPLVQTMLAHRAAARQAPPEPAEEQTPAATI